MEAAAKLGILVETGRTLRMQLYLDKKFEEKTNKLVDREDKLKFHTADFMKEKYDNPNGTKELKEIFGGKECFDNPKPVKLIKDLIDLASNKDSYILDFFAGSGTTGQAVLELNSEDDGNRTFILCTNNEITEKNPNGIAYDVTSKRLKRVMSGECYDGTKDFDWLKKNKPYGGNLDVYEIKEVANFESSKDKTPFDVIDETLYGLDKFTNIKDKIDWVCSNFDNTQKVVESDK